MAGDTAPTDAARRLHACLMDFHASPGKYHLGRQQPAVLFASIGEILHLAVGRTADAPLRQAACFFIRAAMLHPTADHYALFGLDRSASAAAIKDRYRLMMRLVHPDYTASGPDMWPSSVAARVNIAYEVLSSPVTRRDYDAALSRPMPSAPVSRHRRLAARPLVRPAHARRPNRKRLRQVVAIFATSALVLLGAVFLGGGKDMVQLVQGAADPPAKLLPPAAFVEAAATKAANEAPTPAQQPALQRERTSRAASALAPELDVKQARAPESTESGAAAPPDMKVPVPVQVPASPKPAAAPATTQLTLADAQPLLATLLHHLESGRADRMLSVVERDARNAPEAQLLSRRIEGLLAGGTRSVRLSDVEFRSQQGVEKLLVNGYVQLYIEGVDGGMVMKKLSLRAEFMARNGVVVMTALSPLGPE